MELFATPGNPVPADAIVSAVRTRDGLTLRVVRWVARGARGTVVIAMGRSEFVEQYFEIAALLVARRFDCVVMDWRGQGQSDREIAWARRGHVSSFSAYGTDLDALEAQILKLFAPKPWFALGHSMGAAVLLEQAHDGASPFERLVLSAPMIDLPLRFKASIRRFIALADRAGYGTRLIPRGSEESLFTRGFANNILTGDPRQYQRLAAAISQLPGLAVGAPTIHWLASAFALMAKFEAPLYPVETLTPILVVAAGADRIVDTTATERFAIRLKAGRCITIPHARHQLMMERPSITQQFWAAFDTFIPGEAQAAAAPPPPKREKVGLFRGR